MWKPFVVFFATMLVSTLAHAQEPARAAAAGGATTPPALTLAPGNPGSLTAEIFGAALGDAAGLALTTALVFAAPGYCLSDCGGPVEHAPLLGTLSYLPRPVLVGGGTSLLARLSGGEGSAVAAMLGAIPGSVLLAVSLHLFYDDENEGSVVMTSFLLGHAALIGGSVWAYRYSARHNPHRSSSDSVAARMRPGFFADAKQGSAGLTLSGTF